MSVNLRLTSTGLNFQEDPDAKIIFIHLTMYQFKKVIDLQHYITTLKSKGLTVGFAPTMGALHEGHLSLLRMAKAECDISVCSIFVNPTQFNDDSDLEKYPRTIPEDIAILTKIDTDIVFIPPVSEVYPPSLDTTLKLDFAELATVMEGAFRPGHFDGMAQVVNRLLDIVQPDKLYMGQKDYQQFAIVQNMLHQLDSDIKIVRCPIIREADGLAMSSRNVRLKSELRQQVPRIYQALLKVKEMAPHFPVQEIKDTFAESLDLPEFRLEYIEIADGETLQPVTNIEEHKSVVACVAVWAGDVRLIDNILF